MNWNLPTFWNSAVMLFHMPKTVSQCISNLIMSTPMAISLINYYPDFMVKLSNRKVVVVETKGREDLDLPPKMARLKQWCADINVAQSETDYDFVFVDDSHVNAPPEGGHSHLQLVAD